MSINPEDAPYVRDNGEEVTDFAKLTKAELLVAVRQLKAECRTLRKLSDTADARNILPAKMFDYATELRLLAKRMEDAAKTVSAQHKVPS